LIIVSIIDSKFYRNSCISGGFKVESVNDQGFGEIRDVRNHLNQDHLRNTDSFDFNLDEFELVFSKSHGTLYSESELSVELAFGNSHGKDI